MEVGRFLGSMQVFLGAIALSLLPYIGWDGVVVVLALSNAVGGVAHIYGWKSTPNAAQTTGTH